MSSCCQSFVLLCSFYHTYSLACSPNIHNTDFSMFATQFCSVPFKIRRDVVWFGAHALSPCLEPTPLILETLPPHPLRFMLHRTYLILAPLVYLLRKVICLFLFVYNVEISQATVSPIGTVEKPTMSSMH
jgi:hypothetical protein